MAKSSVVLFASFGFLAFWGHETMRVFFSERFADSGSIFSIYVWVIPVQMLMLQPLLVARGVPHLMIYIRLVNFAVELLCVLALGHFFGLLGIAFGVVISQYLAIIAGMCWFTSRISATGMRSFLPWRVLAICLIVALAAGGVSWLTHLAATNRAVAAAISDRPAGLPRLLFSWNVPDALARTNRAGALFAGKLS